MKLVIAEKPSAGKDIAKAIGATSKRDGYMEGNGYIVSWSFGHLVQLADPVKYDEALKSWSLDHLPFLPEKFKLVLGKDSGVRKQFSILKKLASSVDRIISGVDSGREGELIFRYIIMALNLPTDNMQRLWINSFTKQAILKGFDNLKPLSDYDNLFMAAKARSEADWLVGLNATRAYTSAYSGGTAVLSVGRVQTPVLAMIVKRKKEIESFTSTAFWELKSAYRDTVFSYTGPRFDDLEEANKLLSTLESEEMVITEVKEEVKREKPPTLYDLTALQRQINRKYKFSAKKTLEQVQKLYEAKFVSYPRTDSCYLTDDIYEECEGILSSLSSLNEHIDNLDLKNLRHDKFIFNDAKVADHHAIIPTGEIPKDLDKDSQKVYDEILLSFVRIFHGDCVKAVSTISSKIDTSDFKVKGVTIKEQGFKILETKSKDVILPEFTEGESGAQKLTCKKGMTKSPVEYTPDTILSAMEHCGKEIDEKDLRDAIKGAGIGTPATRADLIETLIKREYINIVKNKISPTKRGEVLIDCIKDESIKSPILTGEWENQLKKIEKGQYSAEEFSKNIRDFTSSIVETVKNDPAKDDSPILKLFALEAIGDCPLCSESIRPYPKGYSCSNKECNFIIWKQINGKSISAKIAKDIIKNKRSGLLTGFKSKDKSKTFSAELVINEEGKVLFEFPKSAPAEEVGKCPLCSAAALANDKVIKCSSESCDLLIFRTMAGVRLNFGQIEALLNKGKTALIKGFKSTKTKKKFDARIIYSSEDNKCTFEFAKKKV